MCLIVVFLGVGNIYVGDRSNHRIQKFSGGDGVGDACDTCTPNKEICNNIANLKP